MQAEDTWYTCVPVSLPQHSYDIRFSHHGQVMPYVTKLNVADAQLVC